MVYDNDAHFIIGIFVRAVIDHAPPIFDLATFMEITNSYKRAKSFKSAIRCPTDFLRSLANSCIYVQIREVESFPMLNQIDLRAELDALAYEVSCVLQDV